MSKIESLMRNLVLDEALIQETLNKIQTASHESSVANNELILLGNGSTD